MTMTTAHKQGNQDSNDSCAIDDARSFDVSLNSAPGRGDPAIRIAAGSTIASEITFSDYGSKSSSTSSDKSAFLEAFSKRESRYTKSEEFVLESSKALLTRERVQEVTLLKLDKFDSLYGREKEVSILNECIKRVAGAGSSASISDDDEDETSRPANGNIKSQQRLEVVFISGFSGTGKTTLALSLKEQCVKNFHGLFLSAKSDQNLTDHPFSAMSSICCQLCWEIGSLRTMKPKSDDMHRKGLSFDAIREAIRKSIDVTELRLLSNIVPDLKDIVGEDVLSPPQTIFGDHQGSIETRDRLLFAFRKFFRIAVETFAPIVVMLDDLQWSDSSSIEFLKTLVTDQHQLFGLLIIGCYRSNAVDNMHILSKTIRALQNEKERGITEISVGNLSAASARSLIMDVLNMSDKKQCEDLVTFCFDRTQGNVFFLLNFLSMLKGEGLLRYNVCTHSWSWDMHELEKKTAAAQNVVDLVRGKMNNSSQENKTLLKLAASLGNEFRKEILFLVWTNYKDNDTDDWTAKATFDHILNELIEARFLEGVAESSYRFIHDEIQEAAMALNPEEKFSSLQHQVGMILFANLDEKELDEYIFVVANLQSNASEKSSNIAELNLRAAKKAQRLSAIDSATSFAAKGISFLPEGTWTENPELSLELYSLGAEGEVCLGNFDAAEKYCNEVLRQQNVATIEVARIYLVQINIQQGLGKVKEALNLCFDVLGILGCNIPGNQVAMSVAIVRSIWKLRIPPKTSRVEALPMMTDPVRKKIMQVVDTAGLLAHLAGDGLAAMLIRAYQVQWTLKYGICDQSPSGFAAYAVTCWALGDFDAMLKYNEIALTLMAKTPVNFYDPAASLIACNYGLGWVKPIQSIANKSMEAYMIGMQVGNTTMAMYCVFNHIHCSFVGGSSLKNLEEDCSIYSPQMVGLKRLECNDWVILLWQSAQNLMGLSENTTIVSGKIMKEFEYRERQRGGLNPVAMILLRYCKVTLCAYFGEYETGAQLSLEKGDEYLTDLTANAIGAFDAFVRGICLYAAARKSKNRSFKKKANQVRSKLRKWVAKGNPNSVHQLKLLDAEFKMLMGYRASAQKSYHNASVLAERGGFIQDAGLANERFALSLLELKDRETATYHMERAISFYSLWGASCKVDLLKRTHRDLLQERNCEEPPKDAAKNEKRSSLLNRCQ